MGGRRKALILVILTTLAVCLCARNTFAEMLFSEKPSTVVLLSLADTDQKAAWVSAEDRIRDELEIENVSVVQLPWEGRERTQDGFAAIADAYDATQVLMIRKKNEAIATLSIFTLDSGGGSSSFREIEINLETRSSEREKMEVVAFKTKEAVRAAAIVLEQIEPEPAPIVIMTPLSFTSSPSTLERLKPVAIAGLVTGAVTMATGGVLSALSSSNARKANDLAEWGVDEASRVDEVYKKKYDSYIDSKRKSENYKTGMIITYAIGGLMAATSAVLLVAIQNKERSRRETHRISLAPTGNGFVVFY